VGLYIHSPIRLRQVYLFLSQYLPEGIEENNEIDCTIVSLCPGRDLEYKSESLSLEPSSVYRLSAKSVHIMLSLMSRSAQST
jgi:hypothetical protein